MIVSRSFFGSLFLMFLVFTFIVHHHHPCVNATATTTTKCQVNTKKGLIDMSALSKANGNSGYNIQDFNGHFNFYVAICSNALKACNGANYPSSYYLKRINPDQCVASLGQLKEMYITPIDTNDASKGAVIEYWGGSQSSGAGSAEFRTSITMNCDLTTKKTPVNDLQLKYMSDEEVSGVHWFRFQMNTAYACPGFGGGSSSKRRVVGVGGAILIVVFCLVVIYLIVGSAVMKFKFKKEGLDILVHREYLVQIPLLIWEGVLFIKEGIMALVNRITGRGNNLYEQAD